MPTLTEADVAEIRARSDAASPGPWTHRFQTGQASVLRGKRNICSRICGQDSKNREANSVFIAKARSDIPALLSHIDSLTAQIARKDEALRPFAKLGHAIDDPRSPDVKNGKHAKDESIFAGQVLYEPTEHNPITFGDLRRASSAMEDR